MSVDWLATYVINDQAFGANLLFMGNCLDVKVIREKFWTCPKVSQNINYLDFCGILRLADYRHF